MCKHSATNVIRLLALCPAVAPEFPPQPFIYSQHRCHWVGNFSSCGPIILECSSTLCWTFSHCSAAAVCVFPSFPSSFVLPIQDLYSFYIFCLYRGGSVCYCCRSCWLQKLLKLQPHFIIVKQNPKQQQQQGAESQVLLECECVYPGKRTYSPTHTIALFIFHIVDTTFAGYSKMCICICAHRECVRVWVAGISFVLW